MTVTGWLQIVVFCALLIVLSSLARRLHGEGLHRPARLPDAAVRRWPERFLYRCFRVDPTREQDWKQYAKSLIFFSLAGWIVLYVILRTPVDPAVEQLRRRHVPRGAVGRDVQHRRRRS